MSQDVILKTKRGRIAVDHGRIGISYSGGGPLLLIELGCAKAFVDLGIRPTAIAGVSAGSIAGAAHALDIERGTGIDLAVDLLADISNESVGLAWWQVLRTFFLGLFTSAHLPPGIGDHRGIKQRLAKRLRTSRLLTGPGLLKEFHSTAEREGVQHRAPLWIAATDRVRGKAVWFGGDTPLTDAIVASSAIPGVFPWIPMSKHGDSWVRQDGATLLPERVITLARRMIGRDTAPATVQQVQQETRYLIDGGVIVNQPLSTLALEAQCGTILACAVGYFGQELPPPTQAIDNAVPCLGLMSHQCSKLEEDYVRLKTTGVVHHIHPVIKSTPSDFNLSSINVRGIVQESYDRTMEWLVYNRELIEDMYRTDGQQPTIPDHPLWWLLEMWPDDEEP